MVKTELLDNNYEDYVYDISLDGTFVNALGMNIVSNTDGINFQIPDKLRYDKEHPYISDGKGRNSVKGKSYTGIEADIREFEDTYLFGRNSIDIDEVAETSINFKRNNYANKLVNGNIRFVGNTLKSKSLPPYICDFLDNGVGLLLNGDGRGFLELYYDYIDKIYNYRMPAKELATSFEIKMTKSEYLDYVKNTGNRIVAYEIAIKDGLEISPGETIHYVNTGDNSGCKDIEIVTKYFSEEGVDITPKLQSEYGKTRRDYRNGIKPNNISANIISSDGYMVEFDDYMRLVHPEAKKEEKIIVNCEIVPEETKNTYESYSMIEYNADMYIDLLNSKITPLFVCFRPSSRDVNGSGSPASAMIIRNPLDRKFFSDTDCELVNGFPFVKSDQDRISDVMKMDEKEIMFWFGINKTPPYTEECGIDWKEFEKKRKNKN